MNQSRTKISDILEELHTMNEEIQSTVLIGEKVDRIQDAGFLYNRIKTLITPYYLSDEEFEWLKNIAIEWNETTTEYNRTQAQCHKQENGTSNNNEGLTIEEIEQALKEAIDELTNNLDDDFRQDQNGFDGGDGIY